MLGALQHKHDTKSLGNSIGMWKTTVDASFKPIAQMNIKCGIYQGDVLSPLLFCVSLNPLSHIITKSDYGYLF